MKVKSNFPVMIGKEVIPKKDCDKLINEIKNASAFDDLIQGGRNRINKGSSNFKNYLKKSKLSNKLYKQFNSQSFYKKVENRFKKTFKDYGWSNAYLPSKFLREKFTNKKLMNSKELMKMLGKTYKNPNVNLDIDFSVSRGGYRLRPHRDDVTRLYNFLIYLNDIPNNIYNRQKQGFELPYSKWLNKTGVTSEILSSYNKQFHQRRRCQTNGRESTSANSMPASLSLCTTGRLPNHTNNSFQLCNAIKQFHIVSVAEYCLEVTMWIKRDTIILCLKNAYRFVSF